MPAIVSEFSACWCTVANVPVCQGLNSCACEGLNSAQGCLRPSMCNFKVSDERLLAAQWSCDTPFAYVYVVVMQNHWTTAESSRVQVA
jgi:hypothetical protein